MFRIEEMTEEAARLIAKWCYPFPYEMYSFNDNEDEVDELLNGLHFAVYIDKEDDADFLGEPCGFVAFGWSAQIQDKKLNFIYEDESFTDIAFGLRPELCGQGLGRSFVQAVIDFARSVFEEDKIRLTVDTKNERACKLYESIGFKEIYTFKTNSVDTAKGKTLHMKIMTL